MKFVPPPPPKKNLTSYKSGEKDAMDLCSTKVLNYSAV